MRSISFDVIRAEIRNRLGENAGALQTTPKLLEEITGCKAMGNDTFIWVEAASLLPMFGAMPIWVNPEVIAKKSEELHRKYYYEDQKCHTYRETLYCVCPQGTLP